MTKILNLLVLTACLIGIVLSNGNIYNTTGAKILVSKNLQQIQFSPDQRYLALADSSLQIELRDGVTYFPYKTIPYSTSSVFSSFSFSQDETKFAIGFTSATAEEVKIYSSSLTENLVMESTEQVKNLINSADPISIRGLCWNADNTRVVYLTSQGKVVSWRLSDNDKHSFDLQSTAAIGAIACSPYYSGQFVVAVADADGKSTKLKLMSIDAYTNEVSSTHNFTLVDQNEAIYSLTFSSSGQKFYRSTNVGLYETITRTYEDLKIPVFDETLKDFRKIRRSKKGDILTVSTKQNQLYIMKQKPNSENAIETQTQTVYMPNYGLSQSGVGIFYLISATEGTPSSQCPVGQYLDKDTDVCSRCKTPCLQCLGSASYCFQCDFSNYLSSDNQCLGCMDRCKICRNATYCTSCHTPFSLITNKYCGCPSGQFVDGVVCSNCVANCQTCSDSSSCSTCTKGFFVEAKLCKACEEGCQDCQSSTKCLSCTSEYSLQDGLCQKATLPTWAIVLLILLGISIVIIIIGIVFIRMKRQKRSPLLADSDQAAANQ